METILAHKIVFNGEEYPLSIVEISDDGREIKITPFVAETHSTKFVEGTIYVSINPNTGKYEVNHTSTV